jgi:hypothetical protein
LQREYIKSFSCLWLRLFNGNPKHLFVSVKQPKP